MKKFFNLSLACLIAISFFGLVSCEKSELLTEPTVAVNNTIDASKLSNSELLQHMLSQGNVTETDGSGNAKLDFGNADLTAELYKRFNEQGKSFILDKEVFLPKETLKTMLGDKAFEGFSLKPNEVRFLKNNDRFEASITISTSCGTVTLYCSDCSYMSLSVTCGNTTYTGTIWE